MSTGHPLDDELNLKLLQLICSGRGVAINISALSKRLKRHRITVKDRVDKLLAYEIIDKPIYPFACLLKEYPLLVISKSEFFRDQKTNSIIEKDPHIYAAFFFKEDCYNTLTFEFHKDISSYQKWLDSIIAKITVTDTRCPSNALFLSTDRLVKLRFSAPIKVVKQNLEHKLHTEINGLPIDSLSLEIMENVLHGKGIRTNESLLAKELNVNRKTVERKLKLLQEHRIISKPVCFFPSALAPPKYILVLSLFEIRCLKHRKVVMNSIRADPHITLILKTNVDHYNLVFLSTFFKIEDHLKWQEELDQKFPNCIGAVRNTYLSSEMTFAIRPEYVSLELIKNRLRRVQRKLTTHQRSAISQLQ